jgi:uncharacterized protein YkwD
VKISARGFVLPDVNVRIHAVLAATLAFVLIVPSAAALTTTPKAAIHRSSEESMIADMNRERASHGLAPLRMNVQLALAAGDRANDMIAKHYFSHVAPDGRLPWYWIEKRGYDYTEVGENLAVGYRGATVVNGWMHSPEHRENVLKPEFTEVGIAILAQSPAKAFRGPLVVALYGTR